MKHSNIFTQGQSVCLSPIQDSTCQLHVRSFLENKKIKSDGHYLEFLKIKWLISSNLIILINNLDFVLLRETYLAFICDFHVW